MNTSDSLLNALLLGLKETRVAPQSGDATGALLATLSARVTRETNLERACSVYRAALERAYREEKARLEPSHPQHAEKIARAEAFLNDVQSLCTAAVQPFDPAQALLPPHELRDRLNEFQVTGHDRFPGTQDETISGGLLFPNFLVSSGRHRCHQMLANGLIHDVHGVTALRDGQRHVQWSTLAERLALVFKAAQKMARATGYQGDLVAHVTLDAMQDCWILALLNDIDNDPHPSLLSSYSWEFMLPASVWNDDHALREIYIGTLQTLCWDLGLGRISRAAFNVFLQPLTRLLS